MDALTVERYLSRAAAATSVRELHDAVRALRRAHPADPDVDRVERACWHHALGLVARTPARPPAPPRGTAGPRTRGDWKARAALMEVA